MTKGAELEDRVVAHVRRVAAVRGHGILRDAQQQAGVSDAYLRNVSAGSVGLGRIRAILEGCELDPAEIVRNALEVGPVARFVADALRLAPYVKDLPPPVRKTIYRMRAKWEEQDAGVDLESIDALRYEDPRAALKAIEQALRVVSGPKTYARALGIWGSAQAKVYRLDYATMGIGLAIEAAQVACDRELVAVLLQRAAYALRDRGEMDWALGISDTMLELRASLHSIDGMGRAFVVHGILLYDDSDYAASVRCSRAGLGLLNSDSAQWRATANHTLSLALAAQGDLDAAEKSVQSAAALGISTPHRTGRLAWVRGRIAQKRGDLKRAAAFYRETLALLTAEPIDAALAGAELVRILLETGRSREAQKTAAGLSSIADTVCEHPLDFDQAISAAVLDLALAGLEAKASAALAARVVKAIERGRATAAARLHRDLKL